MTLRTKPVIIRTHQLSVLKQLEQYYHGKLLLYKPWRNEITDLQGPDGLYKTQYYNCKGEFSERMGFYEPNMEEYCEVVQELEENGPPEDAWANLAPQTKQQEHEDRREGATADEQFDVLEPASNHAQPLEGPIPHGYELESRKNTTSEWLAMTVSLNTQQRCNHQFIVQWCIEMSMTYKTSRCPEPFHIFISGGAGTGKSHLIRTIVQTATHLLSVGQGEEDITVMVSAIPFTLHSVYLSISQRQMIISGYPVTNLEVKTWKPLSPYH